MYRQKMILLAVLCTLLQINRLDAATDVFGITMMYPTKSGSSTWDSRHWANGNSRSITGRDSQDPTGWSQSRGDGYLRVDGSGVLHMGGTEPRIYINGYPGSTETKPEVFWKNVELTVYYQRRGTTGANWGGLVVGVRSGPNGHSSDGDPCDATTYYARFRHDAKRDIEKELKHSASSPMRQQIMWPGLSRSPAGRWIGMKYIVYNVNNDQNVRLLLYCDTTTGGQATNGGKWDLLTDYTDNGSWSADAPDCSYDDNLIITNGGGVILIRNTEADTALYKMFSIREIDPVQTGINGMHLKNVRNRECIISLMQTANPSLLNATVSLDKPLVGEGTLRIVDLSGRIVARSILPAGRRYYNIPLSLGDFGGGVYCAVVQGSGVLHKNRAYVSMRR